jgi:hypothetical protein
MTTARAIIEDTLTFGLNRLSPGEAADADTLATCMRGLNSVVDEINGGKSMLFREVLTASGAAISAATALLGTDWTTLVPGDEVIAASYSDGSQDVPMHELTMAQYQAIADKTTSGDPEFWAHDGLSTLYFYPVPNSKTITLRTKAAMTEFAAVDTDYTLPKGYRSALSALLCPLLAPVMNPGVMASAVMQARSARLRLLAQNVNPAILNAGRGRASILRGW